MEKEWEALYEALHYIPLVVNITSTAASYHYTQDEYLQVFRSIDKEMFDYEGTLDEQAVEEIARMKTEARARKKKISMIYTKLMIVAFICQTLRKPLNYIIDGRGKKDVDGENNLIWDVCPFGIYMPYADYWAPYLIGHFLCWSCSAFSAITAVASALTYQAICEELLADYSALDLTLSTIVQRAERLFSNMNRGFTGNASGTVTFDYCLEKCLKVSIKHHHEIIRLFNIVKKLLYIPLFFTIFDTGIVMCFSGFIMISDDFSPKFKLLLSPVMLAESGIAFMFCYYGEELTEMNKNIGNRIYFSQDWMKHFKSIKPYALTVKSYCDIPNELSAGGFTKVNRLAFSNILSAAYSYLSRSSKTMGAICF
ncbi:hypothetical protein GE061_009830 [Apolygus lucorum]|uniref:Odorant receptor n=1 Tax=Apolygus lucorum TaxID=248454 RepID=A0A8S9Y3E3_APOLU|nr:hypothetical protein GE061_009830 [Apolygus lucorum]